MLSPRIVRPDAVTLFTKLPEEVNGEAQYKKTVIPNVRVTGKILNNMLQSTNDLKIVDDIVVTIDLTDSPEGYIPYEEWLPSQIGWTIQPNKDYFQHGLRVLSIIGVEEKPQLDGSKGFLEVKCKRK